VRLLLDTHVLIWWMTDDRRLSKKSRQMMASQKTDVAVSAASFWEIEIKRGLQRVEVDLDRLEGAIDADQFENLPIRIEHTRQLGRLPAHHKDPFDRILMAQAIEEQWSLLTADRMVLAYEGVRGLTLIPA
jgi:PIN domain nuclease of toxin-antitoxin system